MSDQRPVSELREHEQADLVPEMSHDEYHGFLADVAEHGLTTPLDVTETGVVLDGRHRLRAARELGLKQVPVRIVSPDDPVEHIVRAATQRRHISQSQKAAVAVGYREYQLALEQAYARRRANLSQNVEVATLPPRGERTRELAARLVGVSPRTVQDVETVRKNDPTLFAQIKNGQLSAEKAAQLVRRRNRDEQIGAAPPLPSGLFELVYADPPWQLGNPHSSYAPEQHYPTMPLDEIKQLPAPAAEDALLYLWAVNPHLPEALEVMQAWGFGYCSNEVWVKPSIGLGVWTRNRHELLLIGRRGKASPPDPQLRLGSVIEAPRGRHSQKPEIVYQRLERLYPHLAKLELFARGTPRPGWTAWGNEVEDDEAA